MTWRSMRPELRRDAVIATPCIKCAGQVKQSDGVEQFAGRWVCGACWVKRAAAPKRKVAA